MTLRDARDLALDELASLVDISYKEEVNGVVRVSVEGNEFVNENGYYKVEKQTDKATGFVTPYWSHLSDPDKGEYTYLFNFNRDISTENKNDMGEIKALVLARGDKVANYKDILGVDGKTYDDTTGMSVMLVQKHRWISCSMELQRRSTISYARIRKHRITSQV